MGKTIDVRDGGLGKLRGRFDSWRNGQIKSKTIPQELLDAAAGAASQLGVNRVARALGLNYQRLKQQVAAPEAGPRGPRKRQELQSVAGQFIEVGTVAGLAPPAAADPMVVELVAPDGARLTIRTRQADASMLALISAFRGQS